MSAEVKLTSKRMPCALSLRPAARASLMPFSVRSTSRQPVFQVPLALAVAHEHENSLTHS
jgi:hypothetical protein